ncbi:MAG: hypothetical protein OXH06_19440 [Gemmatimonadetes bacterium]|nr:hypothetical protein [Gemmatimonadota bacterium]
MSKRKRTQQSKRKLTVQETEEAAKRLMMGAQARQYVSKFCLDSSGGRVFDVTHVYLSTISFELILHSIEQSLRLLLLIHFSVNHPTHNIHALYRRILRESRSKVGIRQEIVDQVNTQIRLIGMNHITENDIQACLRKHDSSYSSFRYFGLDSDAFPTLMWEMKEYEIKILHCLALALITLNLTEMQKRNMPILGSISEVPESEMTDDLKDLMKRLQEDSTR